MARRNHHLHRGQFGFRECGDVLAAALRADRPSKQPPNSSRYPKQHRKVTLPRVSVQTPAGVSWP